MIHHSREQDPLPKDPSSLFTRYLYKTANHVTRDSNTTWYLVNKD